MGAVSEKIKISVVLCTYNGEKYLSEQLDTLIRQTYSFYELIICDDASTDSTLAIIREFEKKDTRIKVFQNSSNLGFNKNFETAIKHSTGNWIAPADQDDIWEINKLEIMSGEILPDTTLVHCNSTKFYGTDSGNKIINPSYQKFSGSDARKLFFYNTIEGHAMLIQRSVAEAAFPLPDDIYYDWWLGFHAALKGTVVWNKNYLVNRRIHEQNASEKQMATVRENKKLLQQALYYTEHFTKAAIENSSVSSFGKVLLGKLQLAINGIRKPLFFFMLRNRKLIYYYKPYKPLVGTVGRLKAIFRFLKS